MCVLSKCFLSPIIPDYWCQYEKSVSLLSAFYMSYLRIKSQKGSFFIFNQKRFFFPLQKQHLQLWSAATKSMASFTFPDENLFCSTVVQDEAFLRLQHRHWEGVLLGHHCHPHGPTGVWNLVWEQTAHWGVIATFWNEIIVISVQLSKCNKNHWNVQMGELYGMWIIAQQSRFKEKKQITKSTSPIICLKALKAFLKN